MTITQEPCQPGTPLYNSRIIAGYVRFVKRYHRDVDVDDLLAHAGMEPYQVKDEDQWFTQDQVNLFHRRLVEVTNDGSIARETGRYAASFDSLGIMKTYALGFVNPVSLCKMIANAVCHFTRSCVWEAHEAGPNTIHITVTPRPGAEEEPFQCDNRMGYLEAIFTLFQHKLPVIEHRECIFKGDRFCKYAISWRTLNSEIWRKTRNYLSVPLFAASVALFFLSSSHTWVLPLFLSLAVFFGLSKRIWDTERRELHNALGAMRTSTDTLFEKIEASYNSAHLVHEVGTTLSGNKNIDSMLGEVARILEKRLDYDRGMILLADKEKQTLAFKAGFGYTEEQKRGVEKTFFHLRPESKGAFVVCFRERRPLLVNDVDQIRSDLSLHSVGFIKEMGVKSFICCPIVWADEAAGVLVVDNVRTKRALLQSDIDLLMLLTPAIGMGLQNAAVTEMKERQFNSILQALASSIDARDPLTAGHSERVTRFATGVCAELGLSEEYAEMIRVASLLHDYGKIAIKDSILKKPGALTPDEYEEIKTHAAKTKEILEKIEFEGIYKEVPEIASSHHEKWDGTGYPKGLKLNEIPLGARILAVADVFEAITSRRHYRGPMPLEEAFEVLETSKNKHFDPSIVDAFIEYYRKEGQAADSVSEVPADSGILPLRGPTRRGGRSGAKVASSGAR